MQYRTRKIMQYLLPIAIWLSAVGICILFGLLSAEELLNNYLYVTGVAIVLLLIPKIFSKTDKYQDSHTEELFQTGLILGACSYFVPSLLLLTPILWLIILRYYTIHIRDIIATLLAYSALALIFTSTYLLGWTDCPWQYMFERTYNIGWIPIIIVAIAKTASQIIARYIHGR